MLSSVYILLANARRRSDRQSTANNNGMDSSSPRHLECQTEGANHRLFETWDLEGISVSATSPRLGDYMVNAALGEGARLFGDQFSMADISAFTIAASIRDQLDWAVLSRLSRWFDAIEARPAVQRGLKAFQDH